MGALADVAAFDLPVRERAGTAIDHAHLARYTFGNKALELEVLQLFVAQAPEYVEQLRSAATE